MAADDLPQRWLTALSQKYEITLCLSASLCPKSFVWTIGKLRYNYIKLFSYGKYFIMWWGVTLKLSNYDLLDSYVFLIEGLLHIFLSNLFISWSKFIAVNSCSCPHFSYVLRHPQLLHIYSAIWYVDVCCDAADCDRCDLLQLIRSYSSCATRSARLRLCRLHVSVSANDQLQLIQSSRSVNWSYDCCSLSR